MVKLREAKYDDFQAIMNLQSHYGLEVKDLHEWIHLWENNPALKDKKGIPIGWVLENDKGIIVGYLGSILLSYVFSGKEISVAATTSFVVDKNYRNFSLLLINTFFKQPKIDLFLNTSANYEGEKIFLAFKAKRIPSAYLNIAFFWIASYRNFITSLFRKKKMPLGNILSYPLSIVMWICDKLTGKNRYLNPRNKIKIKKDFDESFNFFWEELTKKYPDRLLSIRNQEYLDWHFKHALEQGKVWIFVSEYDSQIASYAVFLRQDNPKIGLNRVRLVDFQSIEDNPDILNDMIFFGIKKCKEEGITVLEATGFNENKRSGLDKLLPYKRTLLSWPFLYKSNDNVLLNKLQNPASWDISFYDGDASL